MAPSRNAVTLPAVSIVVAAREAPPSLAECLDAIAAQLDGEETELVVVHAAGEAAPPFAARAVGPAQLVEGPRGARVPELWEAGIGATTGPLVVLTSAHCVPDKDWLAALRAAHGPGVAAVGGAIELDPGSGVVAWAIYFCRYSRFMLPFARADAQDLAADNASYTRAALEGIPGWRGRGFWEASIHAEMRRQGHRLVLDPAVVVQARPSHGALGFARQRFVHGLAFARRRGLDPGRRLLMIAAAPLIPTVLAARIARHVLARRRHRARLLAAAPLLALFLGAWTAGEALGYVAGPER